MDKLPSSEQRATFAAWEELGAGAPTVVAMATLCSRAIVSAGCDEPVTLQDLSPEARAILFAARDRGVMEIKGSYTMFEAPDRLLAIVVEVSAEKSIVFKSLEDPERTVRFLDGFRQLCAGGMIIHHLYREFSLSAAGFELARQVAPGDVADTLSPWMSAE